MLPCCNITVSGVCCDIVVLTPPSLCPSADRFFLGGLGAGTLRGFAQKGVGPSEPRRPSAEVRELSALGCTALKRCAFIGPASAVWGVAALHTAIAHPSWWHVLRAARQCHLPTSPVAIHPCPNRRRAAAASPRGRRCGEMHLVATSCAHSWLPSTSRCRRMPCVR